MDEWKEIIMGSLALLISGGAYKIGRSKNDSNREAATGQNTTCSEHGERITRLEERCKYAEGRLAEHTGLIERLDGEYKEEIKEVTGILGEIKGEITIISRGK